MSSTPEEIRTYHKSVLRVVSIGVQGLKNSRPEMSFEALLRLRKDPELRPIRVEYNGILFLGKQPRRYLTSATFIRRRGELPDEDCVGFRASYNVQQKIWYYDGSFKSPSWVVMPEQATQAAVEKRTSLFYTRPFAVSRVSDEAVDWAVQLIIRAEGE